MRTAEVGIVYYNGVLQSAASGIADILEVANRIARARDEGAPQIRVTHLAADDNGCVVPVGLDKSEPRQGDILYDVVVLPPSLEAPPNLEAPTLLKRWLRDRHNTGSSLASVCVSVFLLGDTGVLDGRTVTTHWVYADAFRDRFPNVQLDTDRLLIDGGDIISAGGLMAWTDLALRLVDRFLGPVVMAETSRMMLIDPPGREQRYYSSFVPRMTHGDASILKAQHFIQQQEGKEVRLSILAERAGLEERTFLRRFQKATGFTALEYAQRLRISKAQELLQFGKLSIERIAWEVGYSDPGSFRKVFTRIVGLPPLDYRARFKAEASRQ
ncbi:helix-turn-helix domain-containing protein [Xinfangfangia sp. D13-10-4-6]|uniref:GlxA family transcriptional regulator n=1 Tax=Pseudogemmobacter hezensis TaxID=2737662 RepID=UPI001556400A|nr:helix-turn-helix domain-containing protein [Pseudogemmobacter hezensis]NPD16702.1 helix-turn-helix domain-containing protein [Pseudogemmobacter hezensis]